MKEKLLHTPEGVRDIYNSECKRKSAVEKRIHHILELYGYQDIETPTFEFFDIFNSDTETQEKILDALYRKTQAVILLVRERTDREKNFEEVTNDEN